VRQQQVHALPGELLDAFGPLEASQIERPHGLARGQRPGEPVDAVQRAVVTRDAVKRRLRATGPQRHQRRGGVTMCGVKRRRKRLDGPIFRKHEVRHIPSEALADLGEHAHRQQ
jgi:hypothetical protein